jgi:hypothetical protein
MSLALSLPFAIFNVVVIGEQVRKINNQGKARQDTLILFFHTHSFSDSQRFMILDIKGIKGNPSTPDLGKLELITILPFTTLDPRA